MTTARKPAHTSDSAVEMQVLSPHQTCTEPLVQKSKLRGVRLHSLRRRSQRDQSPFVGAYMRNKC